MLFLKIISNYRGVARKVQRTPRCSDSSIVNISSLFIQFMSVHAHAFHVCITHYIHTYLCTRCLRYVSVQFLKTRTFFSITTVHWLKLGNINVLLAHPCVPYSDLASCPHNVLHSLSSLAGTSPGSRIAFTGHVPLFSLIQGISSTFPSPSWPWRLCRAQAVYFVGYVPCLTFLHDQIWERSHV